MNILLPTPAGHIKIPMDIVAADLPLLLGLDMLDMHGLQFLSVENILQCLPGDWYLPVI
jgi:hypothetical protein